MGLGTVQNEGLKHPSWPVMALFEIVNFYSGNNCGYRLCTKPVLEPLEDK